MAFKFNPFTGNFDIVGAGSTASDSPFVYRLIPTGDTVTIPVNRILFYSDPITIDGTLIINGELIEVD